MSIVLNSRVGISPEVMFQEVGGETVLLDLASEHYFGLDAVGTRVWELLDQHACVSDVYRQLQQDYEVEPARLEQDLLALLNELLQRGLVESLPA